MFATDESIELQFNDLYQLDVEVSQYQPQINRVSEQVNKINTPNLQEKEDVVYKCQQYIENIKGNLKKKYQNNIVQVDKNSKPLKKKRIKKINDDRCKELDRKLKKTKSYLNRLWANRIFNYLKKIMKEYSLLKRKINHLKKVMISASKINELAIVFQRNPWICQIMNNQNQNFLAFIYQQKVCDQTKLLLLETYHILLQGIKNPQTLVSWSLQQNYNTKQSNQLLSKFRDKSFEQIHQLALLEYQNEKKHYQSNKCSSFNNISYFWFKYLKENYEQPDFKSIYQSHQIYQKLSDLFSYTPSISTIRNLLSVKQLAEYIKTKIESKSIIRQLVLKSKSNLLNKINMMITLNQFISAVNDSQTLNKWII